jgi:raffinose/stachyose/melibiose transport system substrate-binding protein
MSALSDAGNFLPLTTKDVPALGKLAPGILAAAQGYTDKRQFGVPYAASVMGVWYNPELFAKAGIRQTPTTFDSFITTLNRLKAAGIQPLANSSGNPGNGPGLEQMHATISPTFYGGNTYFNDLVAGKTTFTNKAYVEGLEAVKTLSKYFPEGHEGIDYNTARSLFATGKAAIYIGGNYELTYFKQVNPTASIGWFQAPAKSAGSTKYVTAWGDGAYAINAKTANKDAAIKFLNFLASKQFGQAMSDEIFTIPVAPYVKINDPIVNKINSARAQFSTPFLNVVGFRFGTPTSSNIIQPGLQKLVAGGTTSAALAKDIQTAVASWYKPLAGKE